MKFEEIENLDLNKLIDQKVRASKEYETREDIIAYCVRKEFGLLKVEAPKKEAPVKEAVNSKTMRENIEAAKPPVRPQRK